MSVNSFTKRVWHVFLALVCHQRQWLLSHTLKQAGAVSKVILKKCLFLMLFASFFSAMTTLSLHAQSLSVSLSYPLFSTAPCFFLSSSSCSIAVRLFFLASFFHCSLLPSFWLPLYHAYELVEDDVGEETIAQTSTAEQSGPL